MADGRDPDLVCSTAYKASMSLLKSRSVVARITCVTISDE